MDLSKFNRELAAEILRRFNAKNWNIYRGPGVKEIFDHRSYAAYIFRTLSQDPLKVLEKGMDCDLYPTVPSGRDPEFIVHAFNVLADALEGNHPRMKVNGSWHQFSVFRLDEIDVELVREVGSQAKNNRVSYGYFVEGIETYVDAHNPNPYLAQLRKEGIRPNPVVQTSFDQTNGTAEEPRTKNRFFIVRDFSFNHIKIYSLNSHKIMIFALTEGMISWNKKMKDRSKKIKKGQKISFEDQQGNRKMIYS